MAINEDRYEEFGSRFEVDNYQAKILSVAPEFQEDLKIIREDFLIPYHLKPFSDSHIGYLLYIDRIYDNLFGGDYTHKLLDENNRERFRKAIIDLLKKYKLGLNFFTWAQWFVLYQEPLPEGIVLNLRFFEQCAGDIGEFFRVPKNSKEIKIILSEIRSFIGVSKTGRIPSEHKDFYKAIARALNKNKLKIRKPRIDHSEDFETLQKFGQIDKHTGIKSTYKSIAFDHLYEKSGNINISEKKIKKEAVKINKRNERLKERIKKLKS